MTDRKNIHHLKTVAKRLARAQRIAHHEALDAIAGVLAHAHWKALTIAYDKGWQPSDAQWESIERLSEEVAPPRKGDGKSQMPFWLLPEEKQGHIDGHEYTLSVAFEVLMGGAGWSILMEHAPSEKPEIECYDRAPDNPILNPRFRAKALEIAHAAADELRARIAADWPRRSTKPDAEGRTLHPLRKELSDKWHCLHCGEVSSGAAMANNMWHCPQCSATPIDMFETPFWTEPA